MKNKSLEVLYIGKAKDLKKRVSSYFRGAHSERIHNLVALIDSIEIIITASNKEALLLECSLIKHHKPKYNIILRDDKSYPYILISKHEFPRMAYHRGKNGEEGTYYGPYPNGSAVRDIMDLLQRLFLIRSCSNPFFSNRTRPCLQYQIKRCTAPCVGHISHEDYQKDVNRAVLFLEGKDQTIIDDWVIKMEQASESLNFEKAAILRDQIVMLRQIHEQQAIIGGKGDVDVIVGILDKGHACVQVVFIRRGQVLGSRSFFPIVPDDTELPGLLNAFISQYYLRGEMVDIPAEIVLNLPKPSAINKTEDIKETRVEDVGTEEAGPADLVEVLSQVVGHAIRLTTNPRGLRLKWQQMALATGQQALQGRVRTNKHQIKRLEALQKLLGLEDNTCRMVCFDISHALGESTVASCVVFEEGAPLKADYRSFNIKNAIKGDDYGAMQEALERYFGQLKEKNLPMPEILFIDGGKGQLNRTLEVLEELQITGLRVISIAKGEGRKPGLETLLSKEGDTFQELTLGPSSLALHLIQHIRDESHRFAISRHRKQRAKTRVKSSLENIEGVGAKKRADLLKYFGGLQELTNASETEIAKVPGVGPQLAARIYEYLHPHHK